MTCEGAWPPDWASPWALIAASFSAYRHAFPTHLAVKNAGLLDEASGAELWWGDFDPTRRIDALRAAARSVGRPLLVVYESGRRPRGIGAPARLRDSDVVAHRSLVRAPLRISDLRRVPRNVGVSATATVFESLLNLSSCRRRCSKVGARPRASSVAGARPGRYRARAAPIGSRDRCRSPTAWPPFRP
jgi:hypothetical protein